MVVPAHPEHRQVQQHAAGHGDDAEDERPQPAPVGKVLVPIIGRRD